MSNQEQPENRPNAGPSMINAISNLIGSLGRLAWGAVGVVIAAWIGKYLFLSNPGTGTPEKKQPITIAKPIPWDRVNADVRQALTTAHTKAQRYAESELETWSRDLVARIDDDFLPWYFGYWHQQWFGLEALWYWTLDRLWYVKPSMVETLTEQIQQEFANRVLRPKISEMQMERILQGTVSVFVSDLQSSLSEIPSKYSVPQMQWNRYLEGIAVTTQTVHGNREVPLTLKVLVAGTGATASKASAILIKALKPVVGKIESKIAAKGAGKAASKLAAKTGGKVAAKVGGKFLGLFIGVGVLVWDVWDHYKTKAEQQPVLRQNLVDFLAEVREDLLHNPESGIMSVIASIESGVVNSMAQAHS